MKKYLFAILIIFAFIEAFALMAKASPGMMGSVGGGAAATNFLLDPAMIGTWFTSNNLNDLSSNGYNLTLDYGTAVYSNSTNVQVGTYSANASIGWAADGTFAKLPGYTTYTGLTAGGWVDIPSAITGYMLFAGGTSGTSWIVGVTSGKPVFEISTDGTTFTTITATNAISNSTPTFIAAVWDGSYENIYTATGNCSNLAAAATRVAFSSTPYHSTSNGSLYAMGTFVGTDMMTGYNNMYFVENRGLSSTELMSVCVHGINGSK